MHGTHESLINTCKCMGLMQVHGTHASSWDSCKCMGLMLVHGTHASAWDSCKFNKLMQVHGTWARHKPSFLQRLNYFTPFGLSACSRSILILKHRIFPVRKRRANIFLEYGVWGESIGNCYFVGFFGILFWYILYCMNTCFSSLIICFYTSPSL